jgi:hypothetical protein
VSFAAGDKPLASQLYDQEDWVDYSASFTLTASTTNPTKGNSSYVAQYLQVAKKCIHVRIRIDIGSTFSAGSGTYQFLLPSAASTASSNCVSSAMWINDSGTALRGGFITLNSVTTYATAWYINAATTLAALGSGGSGTAWATSDVILLDFVYEPAS